MLRDDTIKQGYGHKAPRGFKAYRDEKLLSLAGSYLTSVDAGRLSVDAALAARGTTR